jgi:putative glycosyltransferase (TIGR04372 family)
MNSPNRMHLDIFFPQKKISNNFIYKLWKRKLIILPRFLIAPLCSMNRRLSKLLGTKDQHELIFDLGMWDSLNLIEKTPRYMHLNQKEKLKGEKICKIFNIPLDKKIVTLIIRDNNYLLREHPDKDFSYFDYRNYKYECFISAIKKLIELDYFVIKIGKYPEKEFPFYDKNFLDYSYNGYNNDFFDIYLLDKAFFTISSGAGLQEIAKLFRKHLVQLEITMAALATNSKKYLVLNKNIFNKLSDRKMTLKEIIKSGCHKYMEKELFDKNELTVKDNTEEEILDITYEMHLLANNISYYSKEDHILQERFKNIYPKDDFWQNYKMHGKIMANYSINYLRKNKFWLE